jgi:hypothetical protein
MTREERRRILGDAKVAEIRHLAAAIPPPRAEHIELIRQMAHRQPHQSEQQTAA